ncbi:methyltransferase [Streptomyces sp. SID3343]|uniref:methyltransferase n=1 Tax=Streptomyces sp. SID3343 TaxID=2690260 RepID=UPI00136AF6FE|nr:methyltransferase [Streptomyces sp. SID3343]MYW01017.1 methyltransferase [Streptomyces sp. SID3343]
MTDTDLTHPQQAHQSHEAVAQLREIALGAMSAAAVRAALRLGVAEELGDTPATVEELAQTVSAEPRALRRLLRALASHGIFAEQPDGRFAHTDASRLLRADAPRSLRYISLWSTEPWTWQAWPRLDEAVRSGKSVFPDLHGKQFFDYLHEDAPESAEMFDRAMSQSSVQSAKDVTAALDLTGVDTVADIGGGQGIVLASLLERHPALRGALLDLPGVIATADPRLREGGALADRARLVPGDCRVDIPIRADLYLIKNILEWDDESTARTLRNVVSAASPGARVVIIENLVDETVSMKFTTAMDLLLLLNVGGRKHTKESLLTLIDQAGLRRGEIRVVNPSLHMFECTLPG